MAEPILEQVPGAIITALQGMTGTRHWGGTYPNPVVVEWAFEAPQTVNQFPHLYLYEDDLEQVGSTVQIEVTAGGMVGMRHELKLALLGVVHSDSTTLARTWRYRLWQDCLITLQLNSTLGGLVQQIRLRGMLPAGLTKDPVEAFVQPLTVIFHEALNTD